MLRYSFSSNWAGNQRRFIFHISRTREYAAAWWRTVRRPWHICCRVTGSCGSLGQLGRVHCPCSRPGRVIDLAVYHRISTWRLLLLLLRSIISVSATGKIFVAISRRHKRSALMTCRRSRPNLIRYWTFARDICPRLRLRLVMSFNSISMRAGFRRHLVGKNLEKLCYSAVTEIRFGLGLWSCGHFVKLTG